ncbi:MAG: recombinase [Phycisphaerae bacterium]|nr:MAG: recombinase [Phycisphaerae bacterium]
MPIARTKRYVAFARVSSREQEREGFSLEVQREALQKYAEKTGGTIVKMFRVAETASKRTERTTFKEMLAYVKQNAARLDGVLFYKIDRAARNLFDYVELERLESDFGVPFVSVSQPMDSNPAGRMMRRTLASMAAFYTDQQSIDVREGHERRVRDGWFVSKGPYGYRNERVNGRSLVRIDEPAAANIRRIFELFATGTYTIDSLCDKLHAEGRVFRDKRPKFPRCSVHNMLTDRAYIGEIEYQGQWHPGKHEPLVDATTWHRVQALLGIKTYKHNELTYAGGLIRCSHCGNLITGESVTKKATGKQYVYYRCSVSRLGDHPRHRVTEAELDEQILAAFQSMKQDDETAAWFGEVLRARTTDERKETQQEAKELQRRMTSLRQQQDELLNLRLQRMVDDDGFATKSTELRDRIALLKEQIDGLDVTRGEQAEQAIKVFELSQSLCEKWVTANYHARRQILDIVFSNFRLDGVTLCYEMRKPFALLAEGLLVSSNRGDKIRTCDLVDPNHAL